MLRNRLIMIVTFLISAALGISAALLSYSQVLYLADEAVTNIIYQESSFERADSRITLITIDDKSRDSYGDPNTWSRTLLADAVSAAAKDGATVIGLDLILSQEGADADGDADLVSACKEAGNVVALAHVNYSGQTMSESVKENHASHTDAQQDTANAALQKTGDVFHSGAADSSMKWSERQITDLVLPYDALSEVVTIGVANAMQASSDGSIRQAALSILSNDVQYDSFAIAVYKRNQDALGLEYNFPELDSERLFGFNIIKNIESYQSISLSDILQGNYDPSLLSDHIVLIGEYEEIARQDFLSSFTLHRESQDIHLQAAIIQSLLKGRTVENINLLLQAIVFGIIIFLFYLLFSNRKIWFMVISFSIYIAVFYLFASIANMFGLRIQILIPLLYAVISLILMLFMHMLYSTLERWKMEKTLKLYMDSSIVDEITEANPMELRQLSKRENIAVLFVDVRGFTTLSESLEPEQVVEILNAYFTVVANAINRWGGTLDKFIGDAAMAIFNAPRPLPDYCFCAVCAADDIMQNFQAIKTEYEEKYDRTLNIGIGIHTGEAIVGNIGCYSRMDYTAIGDTVNTASRLESKAAPGQILISDRMLAIISEHVKTALVGDLNLKGKTQAVKTYEITDIDKPKQAPNDKLDLFALGRASLAESRERVGKMIEENKELAEGFLEESKERLEESKMCLETGRDFLETGRDRLEAGKDFLEASKDRLEEQLEKQLNKRMEPTEMSENTAPDKEAQE